MRRGRSAAILAISSLAITCGATRATAVSGASQSLVAEPWFGLPKPGPATDSTIRFEQALLPMLRAPAAATEPAFDGTKAHERLARITDISYASRAAGEQFWGRMSGTKWYDQAVAYVASQFKAVGVSDLQLVPVKFYRPERIPVTFGATLVAANGLGKGWGNVPLQSAMSARYLVRDHAQGPESGADHLVADAPLAYIGRGSGLEIASTDLRGKIAVASIPAEPTPFYGDWRRIPAAVEKAGAAGLITIWNTPGNMQVVLPSCTNIPCISLGGEDGGFLRAVMREARVHGVADQLHLRLNVDTETRADKMSSMLVAKVRGRSSAENIVVIAHADAFLSGANDNASGLAQMVGLAEYFKKHTPQHDIYFVATPGHHSPTEGGRPFVDKFPDLAGKTILTVNIEHSAQRGITRSQFGFVDPAKAVNKYGDEPVDYVPLNADSIQRELQLSSTSPLAKRIIATAATRNEVISPAAIVLSSFQEVSSPAKAGAITFQNVETSILYHTSGDTPASIAPETLERSMLFFRDVIVGFDAHSKADFIKKQ